MSFNDEHATFSDHPSKKRKWSLPEDVKDEPTKNRELQMSSGLELESAEYLLESSPSIKSFESPKPSRSRLYSQQSSSNSESKKSSDVWRSSQEVWLNARGENRLRKTSCTDETEEEYNHMDNDTHRTRYCKTLVNYHILPKETLESKSVKTGREMTNLSIRL